MEGTKSPTKTGSIYIVILSLIIYYFIYLFNKWFVNNHYGFHQKEQDSNSDGDNCSLIIRIRESRDNTPLKKFHFNR